MVYHPLESWNRLCEGVIQRIKDKSRSEEDVIEEQEVELKNQGP